MSITEIKFHVGSVCSCGLSFDGMECSYRCVKCREHIHDLESAYCHIREGSCAELLISWETGETIWAKSSLIDLHHEGSL